MARGRLSMKLIEHEKTRVKTIKKRIESLKKKASELSILCDVKVCMIIFEPRLKDTPGKVHVWPSDPVKVSTIIGTYMGRVACDVQKKTFSIYDFFNLRKRQVHDEVAQVRKANFKAKFPTWDDRIDDFSLEQIGSFLAKLDSNIEVVKRKIMLMKGDGHGQDLLTQFIKSRPNPSDNYIQSHVPLEVLNHFDHGQAFPEFHNPFILQLPSLSPVDDASVKLSLGLKPTDKSLRMSMMNNIDFRVQSGIASSNSSSSVPNNVMMYNPPASFPVHHDPRIGMLNNNVMVNGPAMQHNLMFQEPKAPFQACFYTPSMTPELGTYNQQQLMMPLVVPPLLPSEFTDFYHDINEYDIMNKKPRF